MINFSFYLTIGRIDEAFKEIKFIKSDKVWEHMALMCLKTRRLDVALTCLGNMGNACGARVVREAIESGEPQELQLAYLAIQLGLDDEALSLFKSCGRYDLINKFYQSKNDWNKAFEIAKDLDRIHLRNTHYHYAKNLEANDDIEGAIKHYEISHTNYEEVPRILINNSKKLESYIKKDQDPKMMKWWAQYLESHGDIDSALRFYRQASDYLSVVRLLCRDKKIEEARQLAESCNDNAACYHLARYYENTSDPKNAVHFFAKAHAYNSAIRIAKENRMTDQLANLALMAGESDMLEAARFYEQISGQTDKAVMLYHKGGMVGKAMELAFETQQLTALNLIAKDLNENSEPRILERAATFYAKTQQYTSAIKLLAYAKNYEAAIKFCTDYNVPLDESTAELLTPPKGNLIVQFTLKLCVKFLYSILLNTPMKKSSEILELINDTKKWCQMLQEIAKCCVIQGNYYSAAKKYTQAGNKIEAMRCLLKTGNTEKIIFFANTARNQDIYILAANYLQTLDWKSDENVLNNIVALYSRSNAFGHLAGFYEACAKAEIDDYRDYEKGYMALNEANRCLLKAIERNATEEERLQERCETLRKAIMDIKKFIQLQK
uniref:Intraflagellar transport protein 140 homolog n=1 Tax=Syphacia muris TaxID=451379 RepID=A0A0N5AIM0_9BILA